jgi:hypothetical protein
MQGRRCIAVGSLLAATILLQTVGAGTALAGPPAGPADDPGTTAETTQTSVDRASDLATQACAKAAASAAARDADPTNVDKTAQAAADAAACAAAQENAGKEAASLAGANAGPSTDAGAPAPLDDAHFTADKAVKSDNLTWLSNTRGIPASATSQNGNYAGANFIHYEKLGYDFMIGDGTGGLAIWSLKNPEAPTYVSSVPASALMRGGDTHGTADTAPRFYEGENPTVDTKRKLVFLARDPRSFGNSSHPGGRTGVYIIDVKDPWHPQVVTYQWVPAGHTETCINDCRYLWTVGPANNGSHTAGQPQDIAGVLHPEWTGVPVYVTDVRDVNHPYTYAQPVDMKRNNNTTAYTHSVDVDQNGIAWTSGFGGVRGFYTNGLHHDPVLNVDRYATATNPIPYAGGSVPNTDTSYGTNHIDHNSYHVTQAASDHSPATVSASDGNTYRKTDLQYVTQENVVSCTSTSSGGPGRFVVADLAGSYNGEDWSPALSATNRFFLKKIGDYSPMNYPGSVPGSSCSAHWFTVLGDMVAIGFYSQGTRILDLSDPAKPAQAGYFRVPPPAESGLPSQPGNNASAAYWHNGYVYVADYTRGIDTLRYSGEIKGVVQPKVCWNSCDSSQTPAKTTNVDGTAGGTVSATLSLTLGTAASFGGFTPGIAKDYASSMTASVISTAGNGQLSVSDPSATATGHLVNGSFSLPSALQAKASSPAGAGGSLLDVGGSATPTPLLTYAGPTSNDPVKVDFQQHIGAGDPLRTGAYSKTLTFTLSTTTP